jgi:hypothetical protein
MNPMDLPSAKVALRDIFQLNAIAPLSSIAMSALSLHARDMHVFQVQFDDARYWGDNVEFVNGDLAHPTIQRFGEGISYAYAEWKLIQQIRDLFVQMHTDFGQPDAIRFQIASSSTATILNAHPSNAMQGQGNVECGWHAPLAGHLDWIALVPVSAANTGFVSYKFVPDNQVDGNFVFDTPNAPGDYEFRYLLNNTYNDVARSAPITVT